MFKTTIAAAGTALAIAAGTLGVSSTSASATTYAAPIIEATYFGGHHFRPHRSCRPVFRTERVWTRWGWQYKRVYVGQRCTWGRWY